MYLTNTELLICIYFLVELSIIRLRMGGRADPSVDPINSDCVAGGNPLPNAFGEVFRHAKCANFPQNIPNVGRCNVAVAVASVLHTRTLTMREIRCVKVHWTGDRLLFNKAQ